MMAVGVASPRAQGQAITSTDTAFTMAEFSSPVARYHAAKVTTAIPMTAGTKMPDTRSAIF